MLDFPLFLNRTVKHLNQALQAHSLITYCTSPTEVKHGVSLEHKIHTNSRYARICISFVSETSTRTLFDFNLFFNPDSGIDQLQGFCYISGAGAEFSNILESIQKGWCSSISEHIDEIDLTAQEPAIKWQTEWLFEHFNNSFLELFVQAQILNRFISQQSLPDSCVDVWGCASAVASSVEELSIEAGVAWRSVQTPAVSADFPRDFGIYLQSKNATFQMTVPQFNAYQKDPVLLAAHPAFDAWPNRQFSFKDENILFSTYSLAYTDLTNAFLIWVQQSLDP